MPHATRCRIHTFLEPKWFCAGLEYARASQKFPRILRLSGGRRGMAAPDVVSLLPLLQRGHRIHASAIHSQLAELRSRSYIEGIPTNSQQRGRLKSSLGASICWASQKVRLRASCQLWCFRSQCCRKDAMSINPSPQRQQMRGACISGSMRCVADFCMQLRK